MRNAGQLEEGEMKDTKGGDKCLKAYRWKKYLRATGPQLPQVLYVWPVGLKNHKG